MNKKLKIFVEDYNVPLSPWYILNDAVFSGGVKELSQGKLTFTSLFVFRKDFAMWGAVEDEFNTAGDFFIKKILEKSEFLERVISEHYRCFESIKKFGADLLSIDLTTKSEKELFEIYETHYKLFTDCWKWGLVIQFTDMGEIKFSDKVKNELEDKLSKFGNPDVVFNTLITPTKKTDVALENESFLEIILRIKGQPDLLNSLNQAKNFGDLSEELKNLFRSLADQYGYLQYYYVGPATKPEYYFDLAKHKITEDLAGNIEKNRKEREDTLKKQKDFASVLTKDEVYKIEILREFMFLKEIRKEVQMYYLNYVMEAWYKEVARRFFWSPLQARYIVRDEFRKLLVDGEEIVTTKDLNDRYNLAAHFLKDGVISICSGNEAKKLQELFIQEETISSDLKEIKGNVAYPGKVRGQVKIVNSTKDLDKFNEGDILVSFSTNPSLVPAMNKAAAIVTNTGGITCHAAIVSRELKTPCVISTKIATKVLKDGDLIEVDAEKGIVRILK